MSSSARRVQWKAPLRLTSTLLEFRDSVAPFQPSSRRRWAIAAPMPREPPVTSTQPPSRADMRALLPAHDARAPHEAGAERRQRDDRARLQAALLLGLRERERDRRRRRVRDPVDV